MAASAYDFEIRCDLCNALLGWWRYAGPFHGSMCCDSCRCATPNKGDEDDQ